MVTRACGTCIYFDPTNAPAGLCRYNPPSAGTIKGANRFSQWATVEDTDWCNEWTDTDPYAPLPVVSGVASAPAGTASATEVMMGLGSIAGFFITPTKTGRIAAMITGCCANDAANGGINISGRHGTGTAPANGDPVNGALWSTTQHYYMTSAKDVSGFTIIGGNVDLALGVPVWFDVSIAATGGGNATVTDVQCLLFEL